MLNDESSLRMWCANGCNGSVLYEAVLRISRDTWTLPPLQQPTDNSKAKQRAALKLWRGIEPLAGTPAERYLRGRGLEHILGSAALGYRSDCPHPEGWRLPALIALVTDTAGEPVAVHRTFVDSWGSKAKVEPPKASLGPIWGGAIRLDPIGPEVLIGEGLESSASAGRILKLPTWAAISCGNLGAGLVLPQEVRRVVIAVDNDSSGRQSAREAHARWTAEGREVRCATPHNEGEDFSDILAGMLNRGRNP